MAESCPTNKDAIEEMNKLFNDIKANLNRESQMQINDLIKIVNNGASEINKKYGTVWERGTNGRLVRVGGMPPKAKKPRIEEDAEDEVEGALPLAQASVPGPAQASVPGPAQASVSAAIEEERDQMLHMIAHIIAGGLIAGGGYTGVKGLCLILPYLEAYFASIYVLPKLCPAQVTVPVLGSEWAIPGAGMINWGMRSALSAVTSSVESCMAIQTRYNVIVEQIATAYRTALASAGITGMAGLIGIIKTTNLTVSKLYSKLQTGIYKILLTVKTQIKSRLSRQASMGPISKDDENATIESVEYVINDETNELMKQVLADPEIVALLEQSSSQEETSAMEMVPAVTIEEGVANIEEEEEEKEGPSGTSGGRRRRHSYKKRKTHRKYKKTHKKYKTRKHKTRKHKKTHKKVNIKSKKY